MKKYLEVPCLLRRQIRRFLLRENIDFVEDKALFNSVFYLKCSDGTYLEIIKILRKNRLLD